MSLHFKSLTGTCVRLVALTAIIITSSLSMAQRPKSSADLLLKNEHGPWLILAASFEGEGAKTKAVQLAAELRTEHQLKAYCLPKYFDYSKPVLGAGFDPEGNQKRMKYQDDRVIESCAVLIGDYDSFDGPDIDQALQTVKKIHPKFFSKPDVAKSAGESEKVTANYYRNYLKRWVDRKDNDDAKGNGPMAFAFKTRNPLLPEVYFQSPTVDKFVRELNRQDGYSEHNLLDCKSNFTVRVLTLRGFISYESWGRSSNSSDTSQLEAAAEQAHLITKALRTAGYEAYQFHDRTQSIVTIGGFNSLGTERADKSVQYDPAIQQIIDQFKGSEQFTQTKFGPSQTPRCLFDLVDQNKIPGLSVEMKGEKRLEQIEYFNKLSVAFDIVPLPIMVPKLEAKTVYSGYALGR